MACAILIALAESRIILCVAAYWTARASPFLQTRAVEDMLAENGEEPCGLIHTLEADGAGGKLDQSRRRWGMRFRRA